MLLENLIKLISEKIIKFIQSPEKHTRGGILFLLQLILLKYLDMTVAVEPHILQILN
jgi:hypothetical protein